MTAPLVILFTPTGPPFPCGPRGYWIEDATGRTPYRAAGPAVRWFSGTDMMRAPRVAANEQDKPAPGSKGTG
jgi:hypothetical protein